MRRSATRRERLGPGDRGHVSGIWSADVLGRADRSALLAGDVAAKEGQGRIIALLLEHGASPTDTDANGKTVAAAASSDWIRKLLDTL